MVVIHSCVICLEVSVLMGIEEEERVDNRYHYLLAIEVLIVLLI